MIESRFPTRKVVAGRPLTIPNHEGLKHWLGFPQLWRFARHLRWSPSSFAPLTAWGPWAGGQSQCETIDREEETNPRQNDCTFLTLFPSSAGSQYSTAVSGSTGGCLTTSDTVASWSFAFPAAPRCSTDGSKRLMIAAPFQSFRTQVKSLPSIKMEWPPPGVPGSLMVRFSRARSHRIWLFQTLIRVAHAGAAWLVERNVAVTCSRLLPTIGRTFPQ